LRGQRAPTPDTGDRRLSPDICYPALVLMKLLALSLGSWLFGLSAILLTFYFRG